jgi:hypothetical protein
VDWLTEKMRQNNFTVSAMHGDMPQVGKPPARARFRSLDYFRFGRVLQAVAVACSALLCPPALPLILALPSLTFFLSSRPATLAQKEREAIMDEFRKGATRVLITTDVWARGLDVQQVGGWGGVEIEGRREEQHLGPVAGARPGVAGHLAGALWLASAGFRGGERTGARRNLKKTPHVPPVPQVSLVINYDLPNNRELYIHRIGRSGRFGRKVRAAWGSVLPARLPCLLPCQPPCQPFFVHQPLPCCCT